MRRFGTQWKEMQTVARYILQRLGQTLLILLIVSFITYLLIDFLPGDPIAAMLGGEISQETYDWWYQELNLDKPVLIRYVLWLKTPSWVTSDIQHRTVCQCCRLSANACR